MKKLMSALLPLVLLAGLVLTACAQAAPSPSPTGTKTAAPTTTGTQTTPPTTTAAVKPTPTPTASAAATPQRGGVLTWIQTTTPPTNIGWPSLSGGGFEQSMGMQGPITQMKNGDTPGVLAESFDVVTDPANPSITFHLRKGVKFSDGTDWNAQAFAWNLAQIKAAPLWVSTTALWGKVDIVDDYTVRINFPTWLSRIVGQMAQNVSFQASPTAFQQNGGVNYVTWNIMGTGPFKQQEYQKDVSLTMVRNDAYWDTGKPYMDGITVKYVTDESTQEAVFRSGGADVLNVGSNASLASRLASAGANIVQYQSGSTVLVPDSGNATSPWSKLAVRQAVEYGLDKAAVAKGVGFGYLKPSYQMFSESSIAYDPSITGRQFDIAKAKQMLSDAGYPGGFKTSIIAQIGGNANIPVLLQSILANIGITAEIQMVPAAKYNDVTAGSGWQNGLVLYTLAEWPDPGTSFGLYWGVPQTRLTSNARPDGWANLLNASYSGTTVKPQKATQQALSRAAYDFAMIIPIYQNTSFAALSNRVHDSGIGTHDSLTYFDLQKTWLSK